MSRWIDADALIADLEYDIAIDEDILNYVGTEGIERTNTQFDKDCKQNAIDLLINAPTIDIVRCKECKWRKQDLSCDLNCRIAYLDGAETDMWFYTEDDDFCSYGERREP